MIQELREITFANSFYAQGPFLYMYNKMYIFRAKLSKYETANERLMALGTWQHAEMETSEEKLIIQQFFFRIALFQDPDF